MNLIHNQQNNKETGSANKTAAVTDFGQLLEQRPEAVRVVRPGEVVKGPILDVSSNTLFIDLGSLGVGIVYGRELADAQDTFRNAKVGDPIEAAVVESENDDGYIELSLRSTSEEKAWENLKEKEKSGEIFPVQIMEANKGGLILKVNGITGFLPVSQLNAAHYPRVEGGNKQKILDKLKEFVGQTFSVRVITADQRDGKLIVSEKEAMPEETQAALENLKVGTVVEGKVSGVVDFGVFVKFSWQDIELEGLVHISELAWQRVDNPSDYAKVGQEVKARVIGIDSTRISLSMKQLREDPWLTVEDKYNIGDKIKGEVLKVTPFGAFVKLDKDIHGLAHISELTKDESRKPEEVAKVGDEKEFTIISIDPSEHRLGLSLKSGNKKKTSTKKKEEKTDK